MQHVESAHTLVARHGIANGVVPHVAHMQCPGGIGQHFQQVIFRAGCVPLISASNAFCSCHIFCHFASMACGSYSANSLPSRSFFSPLLDDLLAAVLPLAPRLHAIPFAATTRPAKFHKCRNISSVVTRQIDRRFQDERASSEQRMIQDHAERLEPDLPFSDVLVPVDPRAERHFRIIHVHHQHAIEPHRFIDLAKCGFQTFG